MSFIFGGDTGKTYEDLQRQRKLADALMQSQMRAPRNVGEGLTAIGQALAARSLNKKASALDDKLRGEFNDRWASLAGGTGNGFSAAPVAGGAPSEMQPFRDAIASIESAGSGDYQAVGPTHDKLGRALGRYQIMEANIGPWSREALGREISAQEFMQSPEIQDAIFDHKFGGYVKQYGPEGAAQAWFAGPGGVGKMGRKDSLGTSVADYTSKFSSAMGGAPQGGMAGVGGSLMQMAELAASPYASPGQKALINALMARQMDAMDPMRQMQMAQMQRELSEQPERDMREDVNGVLRYVDTGEPVFSGVEPQPEWRNLDAEEAAMMGLEGSGWQISRDGKLAQAGRASTNVTVGGGPEPLGTKGQILIPDPTAPGGYRVDIAAGSELDMERKAEEEAGEKAQEIKETSANIVLDEINLARELIEGQGLLSPATGPAGAVASTIDATRAGRLKNRLETIKANIGFDKLQSMRDASPTGGALGQVSEFENRLLQAVWGSLRQAQRADDLIYNLERLEKVYNRVIHEGIPEDEAREMIAQIEMEGFREEAPAAPKDDGLTAEERAYLGLGK